MTFAHTKNRRADQRWGLDFPATLATRAAGRRREIHDAELVDVGPRGARVRTWKPIQPGTELVLDVHCRLPSGDLTTIHFKGTVIRLDEMPPFEVAIKFCGKGRFLRDALSNLLKKTELMEHSEQDRNGAG